MTTENKDKLLNSVSFQLVPKSYLLTLIFLFQKNLEDTHASMKNYMKNAGISSMLSMLMAKLYTEKPEDPKKFLVDQFLKLEGMDLGLELAEKDNKITSQQKQIDYYKSLFENPNDPNILIETTGSLMTNISGELFPLASPGTSFKDDNLKMENNNVEGKQ